MANASIFFSFTSCSKAMACLAARETSSFQVFYTSCCFCILDNFGNSVVIFNVSEYKKGLAGLREGKRPGRPGCLSPSQEEELRKDLLFYPREFGYDQNIWDGRFFLITLRNALRCVYRFGSAKISSTGWDSACKDLAGK